MATRKPTVFISYAHIDGRNETRRIAFALGLYMDVYLDIRLQAGEYPPQLLHEIEMRDYFLFVMTPHSKGSEWCQKELTHAQAHNRKIVLAKIYSDASANDDKLTKLYTYGDFSRDFEVGFQRLTKMMLGHAIISWEHLAYHHDDKALLNELNEGHIPGLISKAIAEWVIANYLWGTIKQYIERYSDRLLFFGLPSTPIGIVRMCTSLKEQFAELYINDIIGFSISEKIVEIADQFIKETYRLPDSNHKTVGRSAYRIVTSTYDFLVERAGSSDPRRLGEVQTFYHFEVAEKLRELLSAHARTSRYLY